MRALPVVPIEEAGSSIDHTDGAAVLSAVEDFFRRYIVFASRDQSIALALWAAHTWVPDVLDTTPRLVLLSPEKRSGKSLTMECLELLVPTPMYAANISTSALFRSIAKVRPTVLFDEADTVFTRGAAKVEGAEDLRGLINSGFRQGAKVWRTVGQGAQMDAQAFEVFAPVALAAIGSLPDTITDRAVVLRLQRKTAAEPVERFRRRRVVGAAAVVREALNAWTVSIRESLAEADPDMPSALHDRAQDVWEVLFGVADLAGGEWPQLARKAALSLSGKAEDDDSRGVRLLHDIREAFGTQERIATADLLKALVDMDGSEWAEWWGRDVERQEYRSPASKLARLLKGFGVKPAKFRSGEETFRGYIRAHLEPAWERYAPVPGTPPESTPQGNTAGRSTFSPDAPGDVKPPLTSDVPVWRSENGTERENVPERLIAQGLNAVEVAAGSTAPEPAALLTLAESLGYPKVAAGGGHILGTRDCWQTFARSAHPHERREAWVALETKEMTG
jgi:hypothetical protein